jgi:hypothetical protein
VSPVIGWVLFFVVLFGLFGLMNTLGPDTSSGQERMDFMDQSYEVNDPPRPHETGPCIACLEDRIAELERKSLSTGS